MSSSSATFTFRQAREEDLPALLSLLKQLFAIEKDFVFDQAKAQRGLQQLLRDNSNDGGSCCIWVACCIEEEEEQSVPMGSMSWGWAMVSTSAQRVPPPPQQQQQHKSRTTTSVVGMATCQRLISTAEGGPVGLVEDVIVAPEMQKRGVGRQLLHHLEVWAREQGMMRLQLLADSTNRPALEFYQKQGWRMTRLHGLRKRL